MFQSHSKKFSLNEPTLEKGILTCSFEQRRLRILSFRRHLRKDEQTVPFSCRWCVRLLSFEIASNEPINLECESFQLRVRRLKLCFVVPCPPSFPFHQRCCASSSAGASGGVWPYACSRSIGITSRTPQQQEPDRAPMVIDNGLLFFF
jgi:hypothetical protein